jgi:hypothetical protein
MHILGLKLQLLRVQPTIGLRIFRNRIHQTAGSRRYLRNTMNSWIALVGLWTNGCTRHLRNVQPAGSMAASAYM